MTSVERLGEDDWVAFREIRLRSLLDSPDAFGVDVRRGVIAGRACVARLGRGTVAGR